MADFAQGFATLDWVVSMAKPSTGTKCSRERLRGDRESADQGEPQAGDGSREFDDAGAVSTQLPLAT